MQERNIIGGVTASVLSPFIEGWRGDAGKKKQQDMEWTELLNYIFRGTSLGGIATGVIFWNKSKQVDLTA